MSLNSVTLENVKAYIRVLDNEDDALITAIMSAAKGYIMSYTDLTEEEANKFPEMEIAFKCLCADMYDQRTASVSSEKENPIVRNILKMHRRNLLV